MVKLNKIYFLLMLATLFAACSKKKVDVPGYLKYMSNPDNGFIQKKEIDGLLFEVRYVTPEYLALAEIRDERVSQYEFDTLLKAYQGLNYYHIKISDIDGGYVYNVLRNEGIEPLQVEDAMNFGAQQNILEIQGVDTAECVLYQMSKTYGLSKTYDLEVAVNSGKVNSDVVLEFNTGILNRGLLKFKFDKNTFERIPLLNL
jgi:hypothetical protein